MLKIVTLKKRQDFLKVAARGHKYVTPAFIVQVFSNPGLDEDIVRVGYTASRKVGGAVQRNRAKRRLRALVREIFPAHAKSKTDYVVIARSAVLKQPFDKMQQDLLKVLRK